MNNYIDTGIIKSMVMMNTEVLLRAIDIADDVVDVIRCKDCRRYVTDRNGSFCPFYGGLRHAKPNDYCSYAERKETE